MAGSTTRARQIADQSEPMEAAFDDVTGAADAERAEVEDIIGAFGEDAGTTRYWFKIHRIKEGTNERPYLFSGQRADLQNLTGFYNKMIVGYGTGNYEARIYRETDGKNYLHARRSFAVEAPSLSQITQASTPAVNTDAVLEAVRSMQATTLQLLERQTPPAPVVAKPFFTPENMVLLLTAAGGLKGIKDFMGVGAGADPLAKLDTVLDLAERLAGAQGGKSAETSIFDVLRAALENGVVEKLADGLKTIAQQPQRAVIVGPSPQRPPQAQAQAPEAPQTNPPTASQQTETAPAVETQPPGLDMLQGFLQKLCSAAARNSDPSLYADLILDDPDMRPMLPMLRDPAILQQLTLVEVRVSNYHGWFSELLDLVNNPEQSENAGSGDEPLEGAAADVSGPGDNPIHTT